MTQANAEVTASDPAEAVHQWFTLMARYCASVDYDAAERIFAEDVASFGTSMDIVRGRKALREGQWESIWENITDFKMDLDNVYARGSGDQAWAWSHGRPQATTAITTRSIVRVERQSHSNGAMESGSRCIHTSPCSPAHHSARSARGRSFSTNRNKGKDYEGQAWSLLLIMSDTPFPIPIS